MQELNNDTLTEQARAALQRLRARVARRPGRWRRRMAQVRPAETVRRGDLARAA